MASAARPADRLVEAGRRPAPGVPRVPVGDEPGDQRRRVEDERAASSSARPHGALVAPARRAEDRPGQGLQLDGGLRLVADPSRPPSRAATASNSRPMLVVGAVRVARCGQVEHGVAPGAIDVGSARLDRRRAARSREPDRGHAPRLADGGHAAGHRDGGEVADPVGSRRGRPRAARRPTGCRRCRSRGRRRRRRARARCRPCSTRHEATWAWWCCTPTSGQVEVDARSFVERYSGCRSWATTSGVTP